jgi:hypothetical protein
MLACQSCNVAWKGIRFPLIDEARRITVPGNVSGEGALLINPYDEDPTHHIRFRGAVAYPYGGSKRGRTTIRVVGLNSEKLLDDRRTRLRLIRTLGNIVLNFAGEARAKDAAGLLIKFLTIDAEYSACIRDYVQARADRVDIV